MEFITRYLADPAAATPLGRTAAFLALATLAVVLFVVGAVPVHRLVRRIVTRSKSEWDNILLSDGMLRTLAWLPPLWLLHQGCAAVLAGLDRGARFADRLLLAVFTALLLRVATHALDAVERIYRRYTVSRARPIKAFVQLVTLLLYAVGLVVIVALLLDRPAWGFLSGIGALSAVLMLVFKDSLLGLAASFQISANHLVHVGDWIEMPKYNADGDVIDISLLTVTVQNWDRTITSIPIYALVSDSFRNWRGMSESGGRRIMRSIFIDLRSIRFCDEELLGRFRHIHYLADYVDAKSKELEKYNAEHSVDPSVTVNGRRMTNLGTFRAYMLAYLRNHPGVKQDMIFMVRQLDPGPQGVPLQVYAFAATTAWVEYEGIQSDLFDHFLAVLPEFGLRAYQSPSGWDIGEIGTLLGNRPATEGT